MSLMIPLGDIRPTDVWDAGDVIGTIVLVAIVVVSIVLVRVIRRR